MKGFLGACLLVLVQACLPAVVIVERSSVIEEESAGSWPLLERELGLYEARLEPQITGGEYSRSESLEERVAPGGDLLQRSAKEPGAQE